LAKSAIDLTDSDIPARLIRADLTRHVDVFLETDRSCQPEEASSLTGREAFFVWLRILLGEYPFIW
jgi:hypothetical protein